MKISKLDPSQQTFIAVQHMLLSAMMASRLDPSKFEQHMAAVQGTIELVNVMDKSHPAQPLTPAEKDMRDMLDLYLRMFRQGSTQPVD